MVRLFGFAGGLVVLWDAQQDMNGLADLALFPVRAQYAVFLNGQLVSGHVDAQQETGETSGATQTVAKISASGRLMPCSQLETRLLLTPIRAASCF